MGNNKKIKFALIGCGQISKQHLMSISALPDAELVAVCDIKEDRVMEVVQKYKVEHYQNYKDLLDIDDVDVIIIATPHGIHAQMAIDAAVAGKHVLIEKPLATSLRDADRVLDAFKENKRKIYPVLQVRFNHALKYIKELIGDNKLGRIHHASMVVRWFRPQEYYDRSDWLGTESGEGALLLSQGIHYVDIIRWLMGPVKTVYADKNTIAHEIETDDISLGLFKFTSGAFGTLEVSMCTYPRNLECSLSIMGSKGTIVIGGTALNEIRFWEVEGVLMPQVAPGFAPNVYAGGLYQGSSPNHVYVYQELIKDLQGLPNNHISGYDARDTLEVVDAFYKSAAKGEKINLINN